MSDSTPTERFDAQGGDDDEPKSRTLLYVLIGIGGALLIAVVILLVTLLTRPGGSTNVAETPLPSVTASETPSDVPSESPTPVSTPTASTPTETAAPPPPPPATGARFKTFNAQTTESGCSAGGPGYDPSIPNIKVSWSTAGADEAWFVTGTSDAADAQYMQIPLNGNQNDFPYDIQFSCNTPSTTYTITLVAPNGDHVQKHWTVTNTGDQF